jgi:hypothetical protein
VADLDLDLDLVLVLVLTVVPLVNSVIFVPILISKLHVIIIIIIILFAIECVPTSVESMSSKSKSWKNVYKNICQCFICSICLSILYPCLEIIVSSYYYNYNDIYASLLRGEEEVSFVIPAHTIVFKYN